MTEVRGFYYPSELIGKQFVPTNLPTQNGNSRYWPDLNSQKNDPNIWGDKNYKNWSTALTNTISTGVTNYVVGADAFLLLVSIIELPWITI